MACLFLKYLILFMIKELDVFELKNKIDNNDNFYLLDVRETWEYKLCKIPNSILIPFGILPLKINELDPEKEYILYCHHGTRSFFACQILLKNGFKKIYNLKGGIDEYSRKVDNGIKQY